MWPYNSGDNGFAFKFKLIEQLGNYCPAGLDMHCYLILFIYRVIIAFP